jgi:hypothetical protein
MKYGRWVKRTKSKTQKRKIRKKTEKNREGGC